ncbi:unnamed protein product [Protopolystoma xenopodis]|uniref:Uncharacterized protein n=1 Tax=Protopolystoma xenopodis TaxID=117903 RepID=A0A448XJ73_9PLAT|nr:unnamed protein product [Protopolystoma xenopodis]
MKGTPTSIDRLALPDTEEGCLGLLSVELYEEDPGSSSYHADDSELRFRPSCDGHRQSQKLITLHQEQETIGQAS